MRLLGSALLLALPLSAQAPAKPGATVSTSAKPPSGLFKVENGTFKSQGTFKAEQGHFRRPSRVFEPGSEFTPETEFKPPQEFKVEGQFKTEGQFKNQNRVFYIGRGFLSDRRPTRDDSSDKENKKIRITQ
jgi:hypothetical protein